MDASFAARVRALATHRPSGDLPLQHAWHCATALAGNLASALGLDAAGNDTTHFPAMAIDAWLRANLVAVAGRPACRAHGLGRASVPHAVLRGVWRYPHGYQTRLRLDQAVQWLMAGTMSLADIAYGVGYPDQTTFTRAFARRFGKPPGAWRAAALA
jgi:AraC-like DNA-binding protein